MYEYVYVWVYVYTSVCMFEFMSIYEYIYPEVIDEHTESSGFRTVLINAPWPPIEWPAVIPPTSTTCGVSVYFNMISFRAITLALAVSSPNSVFIFKKDKIKTK